MRLAALTPTWVSSTDGLEVVLDQEHDEEGGPIRIKGARHKLTRLACYQALRDRGVKFQGGPDKGGLIAFPVVLTDGVLGGVHFKNKYTKDPMLADCQLVLGLYRSAAVFRKHGIVTVLYSNTWRPPFWDFKRRRSMPARGRSMGDHPRGLAMDASVLIDRQGNRYEVEPDWEKAYGGPGNCMGGAKTQKGRLLRGIICDLEDQHVFKRILTPDSDWGHRHHFHIGAAQAGDAFVRARWAGRALSQPLPGSNTFPRWESWYLCYRIRDTARRFRCYQRRRAGRPEPPVKYREPPQKPKVALELAVEEPEPEPEPEPGPEPAGNAQPPPPEDEAGKNASPLAPREPPRGAQPRAAQPRAVPPRSAPPPRGAPSARPAPPSPR
jgi:hypothetical protein